MKVILISIFMCMAVMPIFSQLVENNQQSQPPVSGITKAKKDTIELKKVEKRYVYVHEGKILNHSDVENIIFSNQVAYQEFRRFKSNNSTANALFIGGGALVIVNLVSYSVNENSNANFNPALLIFGLAAIGGAIPFEISAKIHYSKAIEIYNKDAKTKASKSVQMKLAFTPMGMGLSMNF
jgi:hypothetical protein